MIADLCVMTQGRQGRSGSIPSTLPPTSSVADDGAKGRQGRWGYRSSEKSIDFLLRTMGGPTLSTLPQIDPGSRPTQAGSMGSKGIDPDRPCRPCPQSRQGPRHASWRHSAVASRAASEQSSPSQGQESPPASSRRQRPGEQHCHRRSQSSGRSISSQTWPSGAPRYGGTATQDSSRVNTSATETSQLVEP